MGCHLIKTLIKSTAFSLCLILPTQSEEFSVGWELWYPYQFQNTANELVGIDIEIFNLIAKKAQLSISYVELPWQRHLMYVKNGMTDIAFGASYTEKRAQTAYFSLPYRKESVNFFVKKGTVQSIKLNQLSDLINSKYLIGVENGYYYGKEYEKLQNTPEFMAKIHGVLDVEQNVKMLIKGHIDGFLADPITVQAFIKKYELQGLIETHPLPIYQSDIFIMLSKKTCNQSQLTKINEAIVSLQKSGELQEIIKRWSASQ